MNEIDRLLVELKGLQASDVDPFPYADCRRLQATDSRYSALIPDLDLYLSEIAGYGSSGKRILAWSDEKIDDVLVRISASFFDRFPQYQELKSQITPESVPALHSAIDKADQMRRVLTHLIRRLRTDGATTRG